MSGRLDFDVGTRMPISLQEPDGQQPLVSTPANNQGEEQPLIGPMMQETHRLNLYGKFNTEVGKFASIRNGTNNDTVIHACHDQRSWRGG